jgi:hypothetical protein
MVIRIATSKRTQYSSIHNMARPKSNTSIIGGLGFVLLLVVLYSSTRNEFQGNDRAGNHRGQEEGYKINPIIDLSRMIPTTKRVAGMCGRSSATNQLGKLTTSFNFAGLWGYNVFDNLYLSEQTYIAVSDDAEHIQAAVILIESSSSSSTTRQDQVRLFNSSSCNSASY